MVDARKYVVLDVETNGLSSTRDDLLSISIYKPDTGESFDRFLPLELNEYVKTTDINGIETEALAGLLPLSQDEVNEIIERFELRRRTILTYGNLDAKFITKYFLRHNLEGLEYFAFYNFKHEIISSRFSEGNITKDNLCKLYGIKNIQDVHSGYNDCILEWKLFEKMNGQRLLITNNKVFEFNDEYIVPVSYIASHPNMKYYIQEQIKINCGFETVFSLPIFDDRFIRFQSNFNGEIIEHVINSMLDVQNMDSREFAVENKKKMKYLGELPSKIDVVPMVFNSNGSVTATRNQDVLLAKRINENVAILKRTIRPLVAFIKQVIFDNSPVKSQELVVYPEKKIMARCDLSNENAVLEIKTVSGQKIENFAEQLYYESNGRQCYILQLDWKGFPENIAFNISKVSFEIEKQQNAREMRLNKAKEKIETSDIKVISFVDVKNPVKLKCVRCNTEWTTSYYLAVNHKGCPMCDKKEKKENKSPRKIISESEKKERIKLKYQKRMDAYSNGIVQILEVDDSASPVKAKCRVCGYEWTASRIDHLFRRPYCANCKNRMSKKI